MSEQGLGQLATVSPEMYVGRPPQRLCRQSIKRVVGDESRIRPHSGLGVASKVLGPGLCQPAIVYVRVAGMRIDQLVKFQDSSGIVALIPVS